jgi:hypothetical protein
MEAGGFPEPNSQRRGDPIRDSEFEEWRLLGCYAVWLL